MMENVTCEHGRLDELYEFINLNKQLYGDLQVGADYVVSRYSKEQFLLTISKASLTHVHTLEPEDIARRPPQHCDTKIGTKS